MTLFAILSQSQHLPFALIGGQKIMLRGDYTLPLSNFVLDITFKRIHERTKKYTF